jgi:nucleolar complex protein 2
LTLPFYFSSLIPTSRYFPLRFHVIRSLLSLSAHTKTYIPLVPSLVEPLSSAEFTHKPKPSTLAPLDFEYHIRAPAAYPRTRAYQDSLAEEITFLLLESQALMSTSISFPEMSIPVVTLLKRFTKKNGGKGGKATSLFKVLIDKIETTAKWVNEKRKNVEFAPNDRQQVEDFLQGVDVETTAVGAYWKLQKKVRTAKRKEVEKAAREERGPEEDGSDDDNDEPEDEIEDEDEGEMEYEEDD